MKMKALDCDLCVLALFLNMFAVIIQYFMDLFVVFKAKLI